MPPAPETGWPSGYPITIYRGDVTVHELTVDGSTEPIESGTTYRVHIVGSNDSGAVDLDWTFTTR